MIVGSTRNDVPAVSSLVEFRETDRQGRHSVAAADIPAGTLLLTELPAVAGPKAGSCLVCVQCCRVLPALHQCARSAVTGTRVI